MTADRPVGPQIDATPARPPAPVVLDGRYGRVERLDPARHGATLWDVLRQHDEVWTYMAYGPFADAAEFSAWLEQRIRLADPYSYAVVDGATGRALGIVTLMEIRPAMRHRGRQHSSTVRRFSTALATEAQYLVARHAFETLGYRRYEWKCDGSMRRRAGARALRLHVRGTFASTCRQGTQPRRRLVRHGRYRRPARKQASSSGSRPIISIARAPTRRLSL